MEDKKMIKVALDSFALMLLFALMTTYIVTNARSNVATGSQDTSVVGYISDSMCGLKHAAGMGDDKSCTLTCVKNGAKFVLADKDQKKVYSLDDAGQEKAGEFAGQKVKVTGTLDGTTIKVTKIESS